jgi:enoyl-CoA hydratase/carnithine racemase
MAHPPPPEEIVRYEKDPDTKIATITFDRPEHLNAPTSAGAGW